MTVRSRVAGSVLFSQGVDEESDAGASGESEGTEEDGEHGESGEQGVEGNAGILHARAGDGEDHIDFGKDESADCAVSNEMIGGGGGHGVGGREV